MEIGSIDLDPMVPHLRPHLLAREIEDDEVGLLLRHVAIDAIVCDFVIRPGKGRGVRFVATQAALGELSRIVLRGMNVVAGEAGHG